VSAPGSGRAPWGFHRLSPDAARHVVRAAGVGAGDLVVDLGAGHGALTRALVDVGARVVAVELHPGRVAGLRERFADADVTVVRADATSVRLPRRPFRVVANPPWAVAEAVRSHLQRAPALERADLVLPRWLVHRWAARWTSVAVGPSLRAEAFTPPAPTGSAIAVLRGRGTARRPGPARRGSRRTAGR
jgi:23S rRNA (adenine-N6)-dimethyltransferase